MRYIKDKDIELVRTQANELEKLGDYHIWHIYNLDDVTAVESSLIYEPYELIGESEEGGFLIATAYASIHMIETLIAEGWKHRSMDGIKRFLS